MTDFSQKLVSVQNHVEFLGGQMEVLGGRVEGLEFCAEGDDFEEEEYNEEDEDVEEEVQSLVADAAQAAGHEEQRPKRLSRRSAQAVLANHGRGPSKKTKAGA